jgi:hypothetical protein
VAAIGSDENDFLHELGKAGNAVQFIATGKMWLNDLKLRVTPELIELNDAAREWPGLCPEHGLPPMDRTRPASPSSRMLLCPVSDAHISAQRAWLDEVVPAVVDDPDASMRALVRLQRSQALMREQREGRQAAKDDVYRELRARTRQER